MMPSTRYLCCGKPVPEGVHPAHNIATCAACAAFWAAYAAMRKHRAHRARWRHRILCRLFGCYAEWRIVR